MNELIKITYNNDRPTVLGRDLHEKLEIKTAYKDWFPRICEYGFIEGEDFSSFLSESTGGRPALDHQLTIDMAKQICMIQRTDAGRRYREYFLEVEKQWNSPSAVMARALQYSQAALEAAKPKIAYFDTVASSEGLTSIRETAKLFGVKEADFKALLLRTYIYRDAHGKMMPRAEYMGENPAFAVCETVYKTPTGSKTTCYTKITPHGRQLVHAMCKKKGLIKDENKEL